MNLSSRHPASGLRPSADLAGRAVALSLDVPVGFDVPLAAHHKLLGRWVVEQLDQDRSITRAEARHRVERVFNDAVVQVLAPIQIADLRVVVLHGDGKRSPALAIICDSMGQLDLGWIEKSNVLRDTLFTSVAPLGWRAAAYRELVATLARALPIFSYDDLFDEVSSYYWDGETEDEGARKSLIEWHGAAEEDLDGMTLPSEMNGRRPDWMLHENAAPLKDMPADLQAVIRRLRAAAKALTGVNGPGSAWHFDTDVLYEHLPDYEDYAHLPPMTLVPFDTFAQEIDDVARHGMEYGFMDIAGLCPLGEAGAIDAWFASLRAGAEMMLAAQALLDFDPSKR